MVRYLILAASFLLGGCTDPERDPPQVYTQPTLVDLALAAAGATQARMGGTDHLAALCARDSCDFAPVTAAAASVGCDGVADRTSCVFGNAMRINALQLFPQEMAGLRLAQHLEDFGLYGCDGDDPIICVVTRQDCRIAPSSLALYDTFMRDVVATIVLRPGGADFLDHADVAVGREEEVSRVRYLDCVARSTGRRGP